MLDPKTIQALGSKNCMMMSLFSNNKPVGVVYADVCSNEHPISDQEYKAFKKVCQGTCHALDRYARR